MPSRDKGEGLGKTIKNATMKLLEIKNLNFTWPDGTVCFKNLNFCALKKEFILLKGPSGAGKSTFLRILARLEGNFERVMTYKSRPVESIAPQKYRRQVCFVQQTPALISGTVLENLLLPFQFICNKALPKPKEEVLRQRLDSLLLHDIRLDTPARQLSVGQCQRLCLLRATLPGPEILLLDEPCSAQDPESRKAVEDMLENLCNRGITIIMISHDMYTPRRAAYRTVFLKNNALEKEYG